jgi:hypothetical protein
MWLRNWEHNASSGLPISGATVEVRAASLVSPNTGPVTATTFTDVNGMWEFPSLADAAVDIKVISGGNVWWHKGMTKHSVDTIFYVTPTPRTDQYFKNAGFESGPNGPYTITNVNQNLFESWNAATGAGSSADVRTDGTTHSPDSLLSAKVTHSRVSGSFLMWQYMKTPAAFRSKTIAASFQVNQSVANAARVSIWDDSGQTYGSSSAITGSWITLTHTRAIAANATFVIIGISIDVTATVYVDNAVVNLGAVPATYQPEYFGGLSDVGGVPSGMIAMFQTAAAIPAGWTRITQYNGRFPVGAGTFAGSPYNFAEGALVDTGTGSGGFGLNINNGSLAVSDTLGISDTIGVSNGTLGISNTLGIVPDSSGGAVACGGGCSASVSGHSHALSGGVSLNGSVSRSGSVTRTGSVTLSGAVGVGTWYPPAFTTVFAQKN